MPKNIATPDPSPPKKIFALLAPIPSGLNVLDLESLKVVSGGEVPSTDYALNDFQKKTKETGSSQ